MIRWLNDRMCDVFRLLWLALPPPVEASIPTMLVSWGSVLLTRDAVARGGCILLVLAVPILYTVGFGLFTVVVGEGRRALLLRLGSIAAHWGVIVLMLR